MMSLLREAPKVPSEGTDRLNVNCVSPRRNSTFWGSAKVGPIFLNSRTKLIPEVQVRTSAIALPRLLRPFSGPGAPGTYGYPLGPSSRGLSATDRTLPQIALLRSSGLVPVGAMEGILRSSARAPVSARSEGGWSERRDSNPQLPAPETGGVARFPYTRMNSGAAERIRTSTLSDLALNQACLPIPPQPRVPAERVALPYPVCKTGALLLS